MVDSKQIIICADDFAQDERTSEGIIELVEQGRLSAVSCFSDAPAWPRAGAALSTYGDRVAIGLHFNLTEPFGHGERPLGAWIAAAVSGKLDRPMIRRHLERQVERFRDVVGALPSFIDGHQHVHAFPNIRSVVNDVVSSLPSERPVRVRDVSTFFGPTDAPFKRIVIGTLAKLQRTDAEPAVEFLNNGIAGDYSLAPDADYPSLFSRWLAEAPERGLIMCHPAAERSTGRHVTAAARELAFLLSGECAELLGRYRVQLTADR